VYSACGQLHRERASVRSNLREYIRAASTSCPPRPALHANLAGPRCRPRVLARLPSGYAPMRSRVPTHSHRSITRKTAPTAAVPPHTTRCPHSPTLRSEHQRHASHPAGSPTRWGWPFFVCSSPVHGIRACFARCVRKLRDLVWLACQPGLDGDPKGYGAGGSIAL